MSLKNTLRLQICRFEVTSEFPVKEFVQWACGLEVDSSRLFQALNELQYQLDIEADALRRCSDSEEAVVTRQEYWCTFCQHLRAHYRMLLKLDQPSH
jgi:hypothetical protein